MNAVILAGGLGTRLRPLTIDVPKPMVPVNGKPFLHHQIELLRRNGVEDIVLCVGYLWEEIRNYFAEGENFNVKLTYSVEEEPLGTGGALRYAADCLDEAFFLLNGDTYLPIDYWQVADSFREAGNIGLLVAYSNNENVAVNNLQVGKDNKVRHYSKNKADWGLNFVDAGVAVYSKKILGYIPEDKVVSLEEEVYPKLIEEEELRAYPTDQRFYDVGTPERLKQAEEVLK